MGKKRREKEKRNNGKDIVTPKILPYLPLYEKYLKEGHYLNFLALFQNLYVTILLSEALQQIAMYVKILK